MASPYKLRISYQGKFNDDMENSIIALQEKYGYELVTTGWDARTQDRELNFERDGE